MVDTQQTDLLLRVGLVIIAVLVLPLLLMAFAMPMMGMMHWWSDGGGPGVGLSPLWGLGMMVLFFAVVVGIGYLLYRGLVGRQSDDHDRALEELRVAYARGDLSDEEYERRRARLQQDQE